jgi:transcriptional regulator with XRE-family HTH domain
MSVGGLRAFIKAVGGREYVAARLGVTVSSIYNYEKSELVSASWFLALCELADERGVERPNIGWFDMRPLHAAEPDQLLLAAESLESHAAELRARAIKLEGGMRHAG